MDTLRIMTLAGSAVVSGLPLSTLQTIVSAMLESQKDVRKAESEGISNLEEESRKQRILMEFQAHQARVAQELAIAERISVSDEVEIEEFFDGSLKGHVGLSTDTQTLSVGAGGEGRRVVKRVIRFSGGHRQVTELRSEDPAQAHTLTPGESASISEGNL